MLAIFLIIAFLEFSFQTTLWLYSFTQSVAKVKTFHDIIFAGLGFFSYLLIRLIIVLFIVLTIKWNLPLPDTPSLFKEIVILLNFLFYLFFFGCSSITCLYYMLSTGTTGKVSKLLPPSADKYPMVVVLMPIYNEEPDVQIRAVESAVRCNYQPDRLHVFLAFDDTSESKLFFSLLKSLRVLSKEMMEDIMGKLDTTCDQDIEIFPSRMDLYVEGVRLTICRFPHEGKRATQGKAFTFVNEMYGKTEDVDDTLILFIDSDIVLHENAVKNFVNCAASNPKIRGMTGMITCRTSEKFNLYQYVQDAEYIEGQMFSRTLEATLGAITCLPGAITLVRLTALQEVGPKYFIDIEQKRTVDFHRFHLGEDRYLTYLLNQGSSGPYQVRFLCNATCKTVAPDTFQKLLKQRRRWFLGEIANDVNTIISPFMWKKVPLVAFHTAYFYASRGFTWILMVVIISTIFGESGQDSSWLIMAAIMGVRYLLICINALIMTRNKVCFSYIFLFILSPLFNWIVNVYSIWTWNIRSWGGPRIHNKDDKVISKQQLITEVMSENQQLHPDLIKRNSVQIPFKKFLPFPYHVELLSESNPPKCLETSSVCPQIQTTSTDSLSSSSGFGSLENAFSREHETLAPNTTKLDSPHYLDTVQSLPDWHSLSKPNNPYLFPNLLRTKPLLEEQPQSQSSSTSSTLYSLDIQQLAKVEALYAPKQQQPYTRLIGGGRTPSNSPHSSIINL